MDLLASSVFKRSCVHACLDPNVSFCLVSFMSAQLNNHFNADFSEVIKTAPDKIFASDVSVILIA